MQKPSESMSPGLFERLLAESAAEVMYLTEPGADVVPVVSLPPGRTVVSARPFLDEFLKAPRRLELTAKLFDEDSFCRHVVEHALPHSRIFANPHAAPTPTMVAVYDYHSVETEPLEGDDADRRVPRPRFGRHRAVWPLRVAREWETWTKQAGQAMPPAAFAEFLEANVPDVLSPTTTLSPTTAALVQDLDLKLASPSQLVALSRNLSVNVEVAVRQAQTLSSGEIAITYVEQHRDGEGQPIRIPNAFLLGVPIFFGGPRFTVLARLSYRVASQRVSWSYALHRADEARELAFEEITARVSQATGLPVFNGDAPPA